MQGPWYWDKPICSFCGGMPEKVGKIAARGNVGICEGCAKEVKQLFEAVEVKKE